MTGISYKTPIPLLWAYDDAASGSFPQVDTYSLVFFFPSCWGVFLLFYFTKRRNTPGGALLILLRLPKRLVVVMVRGACLVVSFI
jgi:hypothetical protein